MKHRKRPRDPVSANPAGDRRSHHSKVSHSDGRCSLAPDRRSKAERCSPVVQRVEDRTAVLPRRSDRPELRATDVSATSKAFGENPHTFPRSRPRITRQSEKPHNFLGGVSECLDPCFSALLADALRKMTPSALLRASSMRHPAVPNARVLRTVVLHLADTSRRTRRIRAQDPHTDVTTCEVFVSICSMNMQIRSYPNSAMALLHTLSAVKPYSRITTSPGADAP